MSRLKKIAAFAAAPTKMVLGMGIWQIISWIYDNPIWIAAQIAFGFEGVVLTAIGAIIINFCALWYYRRKKVPWLMWDAGTDQIKKNVWKVWFSAGIFLAIVFYAGFLATFFFLYILAMILVFFKYVVLKNRKLENGLMFVLLSFYQDSFIATAYLRHGRCDGLSKRDVAIFLASSIVSVLYWAARNGVIAEVFIRPLLK